MRSRGQALRGDSACQPSALDRWTLSWLSTHWSKIGLATPLIPESRVLVRAATVMDILEQPAASIASASAAERGSRSPAPELARNDARVASRTLVKVASEALCSRASRPIVRPKCSLECALKLRDAAMSGSCPLPNRSPLTRKQRDLSPIRPTAAIFRPVHRFGMLALRRGCLDAVRCFVPGVGWAVAHGGVV